jgi:hypothetical protein
MPREIGYRIACERVGGSSLNTASLPLHNKINQVSLDLVMVFSPQSFIVIMVMSPVTLY